MNVNGGVLSSTKQIPEFSSPGARSKDHTKKIDQKEIEEFQGALHMHRRGPGGQG